MQKIFSTLMLCLLLSGCALIHVHKMDIEQGNIITQDNVNRLHPGMRMCQVQSIMGTPQLMNTFTQGRIDYVYTFRPGYGQPVERLVTLYFDKCGVLQSIQTNLCMVTR